MGLSPAGKSAWADFQKEVIDLIIKNREEVMRRLRLGAEELREARDALEKACRQTSEAFSELGRVAREAGMDKSAVRFPCLK